MAIFFSNIPTFLIALRQGTYLLAYKRKDEDAFGTFLLSGFIYCYTFLNYQFGNISLRSMFLSYDILIRACRNEKRSMKCQVLSPHCTRGPSHRSLSHDFHYLRVDSFCFFLPGVRAPSVSFGSRLTLLSATVGFLESTVLLWQSGKTEWGR